MADINYMTYCCEVDANKLVLVSSALTIYNFVRNTGLLIIMDSEDLMIG